MNMVWHLLWKDIRRFKWWLAAWFGSVGLIWWLTTAAGASLSLYFLFVGLPSALFSVFGYIFIIRVVQEDPPAGQTAFLLTRPISGGALLLAKLCFIFLLVGMPAVFESIITMHLETIFFWNFFNGLSTAVFLFFVWIAALCTTRFFTAFLVSLAVSGIYIGLSSAFNGIFMAREISEAILVSGKTADILAGIALSKILIQNTAVILLGTGIIAYHYLTRRTKHVMIMSGIALIFTLVTGAFWHTNIIPPTAMSDLSSECAEIRKRVETFMDSFPFFKRSHQKMRDARKLINESQKLNMEKPDPQIMAKEQAEVDARLAGFNWETPVEAGFDNDDKGVTAKSSDPGLAWSVTNQCGRISGTSSLGKWAGCKITLPITKDIRSLVEVSGDFKIAKSSGYQLVALGCATKAGSICMFFEGDKGARPMYIKDKIIGRCGYKIQRRFIKIPVEMEKELEGFKVGDETQAFHKMRIVLDRERTRIYYYVDNQLLGILKYEGDIGTANSVWMALQARDKNTELDVLYDNLRVRTADDPAPR
ncbi:MAG: hypothetical protein PHP98_08430 [Kiritimatiellae bacterium]|nr:hypothetical protein [Kiritimatiellia bacterium]